MYKSTQIIFLYEKFSYMLKKHVYHDIFNCIFCFSQLLYEKQGVKWQKYGIRKYQKNLVSRLQLSAE